MLTLALALAALQPPPDDEGAAGHSPTQASVTVDIAPDAITDRISAFAVVRGEDGRLAIGCDPQAFRGVRVQLHASYWLAPERFLRRARTFRYRFDDLPARRGRFETERRTAWLRGSRATAAFIDGARGAGRVVIRAIDVEGRVLDLAFPLAGAAAAIDEALSHCDPLPVAPTSAAG